MMKSWTRALIFFPRTARLPLLITMIINDQKLHAMPIRGGRSRTSHKGTYPHFMRPTIRPHFPTPADLAPGFPSPTPKQVVDWVGIRRGVSPKSEQRLSAKLLHPHSSQADSAEAFARRFGAPDQIAPSAPSLTPFAASRRGGDLP